MWICLHVLPLKMPMHVSWTKGNAFAHGCGHALTYQSTDGGSKALNPFPNIYQSGAVARIEPPSFNWAHNAKCILAANQYGYLRPEPSILVRKKKVFCNSWVTFAVVSSIDFIPNAGLKSELVAILSSSTHPQVQQVETICSLLPYWSLNTIKAVL